MAPYPAAWEGDVVLSDGGTVHVRPIRPEDADLLVALHSRLSAETVYYRFFNARPRLSAREVEHFTTVDHENRVALVALLAGEMIAVARFDRWPGRAEAEVAFVVDDAHQGRGISTALLELLTTIARDRGIVGFTATVLPTNRRMLSVFRKAGFETTSAFADGVVEVTLGLEPTDSARAAIDAREQVAEAASVARLLAPRSVAVVGASRTPGTIGHELVATLVRGGFAGPVYPINPLAVSVASVPALPSVLDVPGDLDLAILAVPAAAVDGVVDECARKRVRALLVMTGGYGEVGPPGGVAQRALVARVRGAGMRLLGPNSPGLVNTDPAVRLAATVSPAAVAEGRVALSSSSGPLGIALLERAAELGLGLSTFVAVGNKADVSANDLLQYWENDARTDVVLLYLESFGNPRKFSRIARRVSRTKPVVAVRATRDDDRAVEALFRQSGVVRVDGLSQLFDVARVFVDQPLPAGPRVAVVGNAGATALAVDACRAAGLDPVVEHLASDASLDAYEAVLGRVLADDEVDAVLGIFRPSLVADEAVGEAVARAVGGVAGQAAGEVEGVTGQRAPKPVLAVVGSGPRAPAGVATVFVFPEDAAAALGRVVAHAAWRRRPAGVEPELDVDLVAARALVDGALPGPLELPAALALLQAYGIAAPETVVVTSAEDAIAAAGALGYPVALKVPAVLRRSRAEAGGVALDLHDAGAVRAAHDRMAAAGPLVVQAMVPAGADLLLALELAPPFGLVLSLGLGGVAAGAHLADGGRLLPVTDVEAAELVRSTRAAPLLFGPDGGPTAEVAAVEDLVLRVSRLAEDVPELSRLRINPLVVSPAGAWVVDVDVELGAPALGPHLARLR